MSDLIAPGQDVTFTITAAPRRDAERKTIQRLMRMQPPIQKGLRKLAARRRAQDNRTYSRAGKMWVSRVRTTKLTCVEPGESFTLRITPQIIPDLKSVQKYLKATKPGGTTRRRTTSKEAAPRSTDPAAESLPSSS